MKGKKKSGCRRPDISADHDHYALIHGHYPGGNESDDDSRYPGGRLDKCRDNNPRDQGSEFISRRLRDKCFYAVAANPNQRLAHVIKTK